MFLAAAAVFGSSSASADSLCLEDPGTQNQCPESKIWHGPIIGLATSYVFESTFLKLSCESEILGDFFKNEGAHVGALYLILLFDLYNCKGTRVCRRLTVEGLPYIALASASKEQLTVEKGEHGPFSYLLEGCPIGGGFVISCLYEATKLLLNYALEEKEGTPEAGAFKASNVPLLRGGDSTLCSNEGTLNATYLIYEDESGKEGAPLFLTALP
jgi:hypothetical protein